MREIGTAEAGQVRPADTVHRRAVLMVMCVGLFLVQLDVTAVNVALPRISDDLAAGVSSLQWVVDAYALVLASLLLVSGSVGDRLGHRRVVLAGLTIFAVGSASCAAAPGAWLLAVARAVQGLGAALLLPGTLAVITRAYPERAEQARAVAVWAAVGGLALPAGPLLGGVLVAGPGWRWVFAINVPIALVAGAVTIRVVRESTHRTARRLDLPGAALAVLLLAATVFTIIEAPHTTHATVLGAGGAAVALLVAFLVTEACRADPMLPLGLFRNREFLAVNGAAALMNLTTLGLLFVLTLYLQQVQGRSAVAAGAALVPMFALVTGLAPLAGRLTARLGPRAPAVSGLLIAAVGMALIPRLTHADSYLALLPALILLGTGLGLMTTPLVAAAMRAVPLESAGLASGINNTARQAGGAIGIAVFGSVAGSPAATYQFLTGLHHDGLIGVFGYGVAALALVRTLRHRSPRHP